LLPHRPPSPGANSKGTIASINSRIDPVTRAIVVRAILPNPERLLKPGLLMQVSC
jgi:membrane fusion protein (multidrug efflux system)